MCNIKFKQQISDVKEELLISILYTLAVSWEEMNN